VQIASIGVKLAQLGLIASVHRLLLLSNTLHLYLVLDRVQNAV